jgi:hypothetical protein
MGASTFQKPLTKRIPRCSRAHVVVAWCEWGGHPPIAPARRQARDPQRFRRGSLSYVTPGSFLAKCSSFSHKNAGAAKDEQRGGDGREPRPHSWQR